MQFDRAGRAARWRFLSTPLRSTLARLHSTSTPQSADLFNAAAHPPSSSFLTVSSSRGDNVSEVTGQLTFAGQDSPHHPKANQFACYKAPCSAHEVCGGDATIDRTQWGMEPRRGLGASQERAPGRASESCEAVIPVVPAKATAVPALRWLFYAIESTRVIFGNQL